jgi:hypothetical protein
MILIIWPLLYFDHPTLYSLLYSHEPLNQVLCLTLPGTLFLLWLVLPSEVHQLYFCSPPTILFSGTLYLFNPASSWPIPLLQFGLVLLSVLFGL